MLALFSFLPFIKINPGSVSPPNGLLLWLFSLVCPPTAPFLYPERSKSTVTICLFLRSDAIQLDLKLPTGRVTWPKVHPPRFCFSLSLSLCCCFFAPIFLNEKNNNSFNVFLSAVCFGGEWKGGII